MFFCLCFVVLLHVHGLGLAVNATYFGIRLEVGFLHLQGNEPSCEGHSSNVVPGTGFHGHNIALFELQFVAVLIVAFACVFELHFHHVAGVFIAGYIGQPIVSVEFVILSTASFGGKVATAVFQFEIHSVYLFYGVCERVTSVIVQSFSARNRRTPCGR